MTQIDLCVLAGGFGTRLRSAVAEVPKPLAPVAGRPYLSYLIDSWIGQGVTSLTFLLHHQADLIEQFLQVGRQSAGWDACAIHTVREPRPLGTGGSIANAVRERALPEEFLVVNADTWLGSGVEQLAQELAPTMAVVHVADATRYGAVLMREGKIVSFLEKQGEARPGWINAGLYRLSAHWFANWDGAPFSLERELFPTWVVGGQLRASALSTEFIDIGVPEDYFRFCRWIETGRKGAP